MTTIDPEKQQQAKEYSRITRRLWLVETAFGLIYSCAWLISGWAIHLRAWLTVYLPNDWLLVPAFVFVFGAISALIEFPLGYYTGFALPHRFGQSTQSFKDWLLDQLKELAISLPIGLIILELLYLALRLTGPLWWLWAAGGLLILQVIFANIAPVLIMPLFNKYVPLGDEHAELVERLMKLAKKSRTHIKGVFTFDMSRRTKAANAALTGMGNTRRIILGDTLINEFTLDEIEVVMAHELGHHVNRDIPLLMTVGTLIVTLGLYLASLGMNWAVGYFSFQSIADVAAFPALALVTSLYGLLTMPIQNGFSRWRERMADAYALKITGKNEAFASAFARLANQNLGEMVPRKMGGFPFPFAPAPG